MSSPAMRQVQAHLQRAVTAVVSRNDLVLAALIVCIIFMMILPLPTWLVDALIATNMCLSAILLMVAMYLASPLAFSSFPSVLLVTTLFRLAIGIATTRLILLNGDAGHIIYTFGNFVVGGNLVVGLVVFLIITIVQFVVITKGAERVAEVGARFSLDAMPGKQMSIDADMRAGTIDMDEARRRRGLIERESKLYVATAVAEYFRDQGKRVLFLMDSVTRFARAQREIGLAAGEPPTRRGFPPSVFATLPRLMERAGTNDKGSITALYTVLVEGDDMTEPVADETRSILDGHIILSRKLGAANHFPAIDVLASASRVMNALITPEHKAAAGRVRELMAKYQDVELLVKVGEYKKGSDRVADEALDKNAAINTFLRQGTHEHEAFAAAIKKLRTISGG